jgi:F0F1-type ATP synthase assembly protein I
VFDLAAKRQLNRGYGDGLSRAIEIVVTPVILGFIGSLVDGWLGTRPGFTIGLAVVGVAGVFVKLWIGYDREMQAHEAKLAGGGARTTPPEAEAPS